MRTLYLPIIEPGANHDTALASKHGLRTALSQHGEVRQFDYMALQRVEVLTRTMRLLEDFCPDLLFLQLHGPDWLTPGDLRFIREEYPDMQIVNWNGDYWPHSLTSDGMIDLLREVDLQLVVNASVLPVYRERGVNAAFWPFGYETPVTAIPDTPSHDVVYLGNNYSEKRAELGKVLRSLPCNVGIYGSGWDKADGDCMYNFAYGKGLYERAKITISDNQFPDAIGYLSNRPFQAMDAGCFVLQQYVDALDGYTGLVDGEHYIGFRELSEIPSLVETWLAKSPERHVIAHNGQRFVQEYHTFEVRVKQLFEVLLPEVQHA